MSQAERAFATVAILALTLPTVVATVLRRDFSPLATRYPMYAWLPDTARPVVRYRLYVFADGKETAIGDHGELRPFSAHNVEQALGWSGRTYERHAWGRHLVPSDAFYRRKLSGFAKLYRRNVSEARAATLRLYELEGGRRHLLAEVRAR